MQRGDLIIGAVSDRLVAIVVVLELRRLHKILYDSVYADVENQPPLSAVEDALTQAKHVLASARIGEWLKEWEELTKVV